MSTMNPYEMRREIKRMRAEREAEEDRERVEAEYHMELLRSQSRAARSAATTNNEQADVAQLVEQPTFNRRVEGSSPSIGTTPTPRGSMPTREQIAQALRGAFLDADDHLLPAFWLAEADAALSLISPYLASLDATARQAEEENARLRERVATLEAAPRAGVPYCAYCGWAGAWDSRENIDKAVLVHAHTCPKHPRRALEAERDAALARAEKAEADLEEARKVCAKWEVAYPEMVKIAMSKPPSASAGTGGETEACALALQKLMANCGVTKMICTEDIVAVLDEHFHAADARTWTIRDEELAVQMSVLCYWAEPSRVALKFRGKPSPEARAVAVHITRRTPAKQRRRGKA
jgi:hypothetical protein